MKPGIHCMFVQSVVIYPERCVQMPHSSPGIPLLCGSHILGQHTRNINKNLALSRSGPDNCFQ